MPLTSAQEKAIHDHGKDILVSASAGSGKTTVLVQRVINEIIAGTSVNQLLVVTFTKAAAAEMKERIKQQLSVAIKRYPQKRAYLRSQLNEIDTANISTIDAFGLDVIHRFYYAADLDPSFSVLTDETQTALLKERALKDVESNFLENNDKDFIAFYDNFAGDRDADSAHDLLLDLYEYAMAKPNYSEWLKQLPLNYEIKDNIVNSPLWQNQIKPYLKTTITDLKEKADHILQEAVFANKELKKVKDDISTFNQKLTYFLNLLKSDQEYNQLRLAFSKCIFEGRYRSSKKWDEDLQIAYQDSQNFKQTAKKQVFAIYTGFFAADEQEQIKVMQKGQRIVKTIATTEKALILRFNQLKREQNFLDYNDMEQIAYQILHQDTSNSQLARDFYQDKFKEILVDEYQDINPLQEKIIQLIKKTDKNTIFMVGDVKQSIYGFRQAEPSLFLKKYHAFGQEKNSSNERILLTDNFRSTKPVTKIVNRLFTPVLSKDFGGIDYQNEGQLVFGAKYYPAGINQATEVLVHQKKQHDDEQLDFSEIQMVIQRIKQLIAENAQIYDANTHQKRPIKYSDIAILTRSHSDNLQIMQEFAKNDLPLFVTDAQNYFQTFELTVMIDYLKIIDNPDQDIPLVTVLRSPIFNFNETELAKIRIRNKKVSFYNALLNYVAVNDQLSNKVKNFLNQLSELRDFASMHRISELIWSIYEHTSLLEIMTALPNGEQRRVNLEALYERAASYESAGFKGLYQFINFINRMRRSQKDLAQPLLTKEAGDAVRLMTIHGSKGLEFPIVFYVGMEHRFQLRDLTSNYVLTGDSLGITIKEPTCRIDSLVKTIDNVNKKRQLLEEEARILYVALTRAKQKLILVGDIPNFQKKIQTWQHELNHQGLLPLADKLAANNPLSFMGPALAFEKQVPLKMNEITSAADQSQSLLFINYEEAATTSETQLSPKKETNQESKRLVELTGQLFSFKYPFIDASHTTAYQSVSEIKKAFNDPDESELENSHVISSSNRYLQPIDTKPNFLFENKFTGAEIGTATHLILQYYDYKGDGSKQALDNEIKKLVEQKKLNPDIIPSIKKDEIEWFVHSTFSQNFWQHPELLKREVDFSSLLLAQNLFSNFSDPNAKILVHGTIDGYYLGKDGIILFDYKTDHVDKKRLKTSIAKIKSKYTGQLRLYEQALNELGKQKVTSKFLILLDAKQIVKVN